MINRRGMGEIVMFFPFIFICLIIAAGIWIGVGAFYGGEYDFRQAEAELLASRVVECFKMGDFEIYRDCNLNREVIETEHLIFIKYNDEVIVNVGVGDYLQQCFFEGIKKNRNYPNCVSGTFTREGKEFYYVVGSNQRIRRVLT